MNAPVPTCQLTLTLRSSLQARMERLLQRTRGSSTHSDRAAAVAVSPC
jgi:hypothetical protein